jgi:translation initiation factor IF-2
MRARGAKATDIAILVVAADDGVMPQTVEAMNHAQAADVPIVVAVNKIDKEGADPQKIRGQLTEYGLVPEEYGGDTMFVDISAKQGTNIDALLEAVLLTADASLDLRANPTWRPRAWRSRRTSTAVAARWPPCSSSAARCGSVTRSWPATPTAASAAWSTSTARTSTEALPSRPVQVIGFTSVPGAGDNLLVVDEDRIARQIADRAARKRNALAARSRKRDQPGRPGFGAEGNQPAEPDPQGRQLRHRRGARRGADGHRVDDEVSLRVIDRGVGGVTETNVNLAAASDAIIIGFNVRAEGKATELANREGVEIRYYSIIYQAIDEIEAALKGMLKPIYEEKSSSAAPRSARSSKSSKVGNIAGCWSVGHHASQRQGTPAARQHGVAENLTVSSLKREKDDATEVREGYECGLTLTYSDIKEGDVIETYEMWRPAYSCSVSTGPPDCWAI